ncbi:hypothetical protein BRD00_02295 [Halobacteriales archaeon QS_8_69_26]|nr:MAG: hypothetical protein BRD00_02295 [Halobacteriales archaeon QS_8_69_26]
MDPEARRERYRNARVMEYGSAVLSLPAAYYAVVGEWTAMLTAVALAGIVYATSYFERLVVARGDDGPPRRER